MPQSKRKRRRKHRGTKTGRVDRRGRTSRPRSRQEARARYKSQLSDQRTRPPTWQGALRRALLFAGVLVLILVAFTGRSAVEAIALGAFMLLFYVPIGYYTDRFFYGRRKAQVEREALERKQSRKGGR